MKEKFMVILVTGGCGFIGSNFINFWLKNHKKCKILNLDKLTYVGNMSSLGNARDNANYKFFNGDIGDFKFVNEIVSVFRPDCIINFAAETNIHRSLDCSDEFNQANIFGTRVLLEVAQKYKIKRFHQISTLSWIEEGGRVIRDISNPYVISKVASEKLVELFFNSFGLPITITNCSNNYGYFQHPEKFIPRTITNLIDDGKVFVFGDGRQVRNWLYVEDNCKAIEAVLINGTIGESYDVGDFLGNVNNLELVNIILEIMGKDKSCIEFVPDYAGHYNKFVINYGKISEELGWSPTHRLQDMLVKTVTWYEKNEAWWRFLKKEAELLYHYYESQKKNENFPLAANLLSSAIAIMELADKTDTRLPAWRLESKDIQPLINSEKRLDKETGRKKSY